MSLQPADIGWPTGNGKKLSNSQAQLGKTTCLATSASLKHFKILPNHYVAIIEGYHNALQALFGCSHPTVWNFMRGIEKDMANHKLTLAQANVANPEKQRRKYQILADRLSAKIGDYENAENKVTYLKEVALIAYSGQ